MLADILLKPKIGEYKVSGRLWSSRERERMRRVASVKGMRVAAHVNPNSERSMEENTLAS